MGEVHKLPNAKAPPDHQPGPSWRCRIGLHRWGPWEQFKREIDWQRNGVYQYTTKDQWQRRHCRDCNKKQREKV